jgi:P-type E1-E2 ATPase
LSYQWGIIVRALSQEESQTPLQEDLEGLATRVGWVGLSSATVIFLTLVAQWAYNHFVVGGEAFSWAMLEDWIGYFIVSVTILVVAVPEGLPLAVTISLAYSMRKMMKDNNLVRHLQACETMGSVTTICTDKTGTLTENRMTVVRAWLGGRVYEEESLSNLPAAIKQVVIQGPLSLSPAFPPPPSVN